jgi:hypothetical protein
MRRVVGAAILAMVLMPMLAACDRVANSTRAVQEVTKQAFHNAKDSWTDFLTYHPPLPDPLPQTRYCYQMQSDIVCYDSEQTQLTSKLVGFQDGETISWVQPGGGSLGASGGGPVALRPIPKYAPAAASSDASSGFSWNELVPDFSAFNRSYQKGQIASESLPPINSVETVKTVN